MESEIFTDDLTLTETKIDSKSPESSDWEGYGTPLASSLSDLTPNMQTTSFDCNQIEKMITTGLENNAEKENDSGSVKLLSMNNRENQNDFLPIRKNVIVLEKTKILTMRETLIESDTDSERSYNDVEHNQEDGLEGDYTSDYDDDQVIGYFDGNKNDEEIKQEIADEDEEEIEVVGRFEDKNEEEDVEEEEEREEEGIEEEVEEEEEEDEDEDEDEEEEEDVEEDEREEEGIEKEVCAEEVNDEEEEKQEEKEEEDKEGNNQIELECEDEIEEKLVKYEEILDKEDKKEKETEEEKREKEIEKVVEKAEQNLTINANEASIENVLQKNCEKENFEINEQIASNSSSASKSSTSEEDIEQNPKCFDEQIREEKCKENDDFFSESNTFENSENAEKNLPEQNQNFNENLENCVEMRFEKNNFSFKNYVENDIKNEAGAAKKSEKQLETNHDFDNQYKSNEVLENHCKSKVESENIGDIEDAENFEDIKSNSFGCFIKSRIIEKQLSDRNEYDLIEKKIEKLKSSKPTSLEIATAAFSSNLSCDDLGKVSTSNSFNDEKYPMSNDAYFPTSDENPANFAMQEISEEFEQLVAAINAFGRGSREIEEKNKKIEAKEGDQQLSEEEENSRDEKELVLKKRNRIEETDAVAFADRITVDTHRERTIKKTSSDFGESQRSTMESLKKENESLKSLQIEADKLKTNEIEVLTKELASFQQQLADANQTIDQIEVEAEQQYTEMTSEIDELCELILKKDEELAVLKEKIANFLKNESILRDDIDSQKGITQRQKEIIEGLREELDTTSKRLTEMTKQRDKAYEEITINRMKNQEKERFLAKEAQMSLEIEDLQRELNKQKLIINETSMAKLADTFERRVLKLENDIRERDMLICKQNQVINSQRKSPSSTSSMIRKYPGRTAIIAAENLPSAGSSSESFQNGLDHEAKDIVFSFLLSDKHHQLANIYSIGRVLDLNSQEERALERHLTKDRFS